MHAIGLSRDEVIEACKKDLNFFAALCLPDIYKFPFPPVFQAVWQLLTDDANRDTGQQRLAIGLPRGFGKTILLKLYSAYLILLTDRQFILVCCNTAALSANFIADVSDILCSPNILSVFGDWRIAMEKESQELKKFTFRGRPCIFAALGAGGSPRGLNIKFVRPDVIIMDDMQSREEAESQVESTKGLSWMLGTLMKTKNSSRCQFLFVGNMYPFEGCILKKLKNNPAWYSFVCGAILADGQSVWPELRSVEDIMEEFENDCSMGHPEIFFSEVMNDEEAGNRAGIDIGKIAVWEEPPPHFPAHAESGFTIIDPSVGKKKSDAVAIGTILIFDGIPVLWDVKVDSFNPMQQVEESFKQAITWEVSSILVESVAYQATLAFWMNYFRMQRGIEGFSAKEIYPGVAQKNSRIIEMLKQLTASTPRLKIHPRVRTQFLHQVLHFNPVRTKNVDDILDLLAYAYPAMAQYGAALLRFEQSANTVIAASHGSDMDLAF